MHATALSSLPADELTARLYELRRRERHLQVEFLRCLAELDRRRLYLELGFSSLFAYCTDHLGLSRSSAFRSTTAARLLARFPVVADYLADGRLSLTTLVELRDVISEEILDRAAGKTEEDVKKLVVALQPRPLPAGPPLRRLPAPRPSAPPPKITPVAPTQHVLRLVVDDELVADLHAARDALSHVIPDGRLEKVIHHCLRTQLGKRRSHGSGERYVPTAMADAVFARDGGRCTFVGSGGRRCDASHQVQLHHVVPFARGGQATLENLTLHCAAHNLHQARQDFGELPLGAAVGQQLLF